MPTNSVLQRWYLGRYLESKDKQAPPLFLEEQSQWILERVDGLANSELRQALSFYRVFPDPSDLDLRLRWQHYRLLFPLACRKERMFYLRHSADNNWSARQLERQIRAAYYQRHRQSSPLGIKAHYDFSFISKANLERSEAALEESLFQQLPYFLLELGPAFTYVGRQQLLCMPGGQRFFIDLLFYHLRSRFHLLVELKKGVLTHRDIGQLDTYVRLFNRHYRQMEDAPCVGLILCPEFPPDLLRYSALADPNRLMVATYTLDE